jgi:hypothetical protein
MVFNDIVDFKGEKKNGKGIEVIQVLYGLQN